MPQTYSRRSVLAGISAAATLSLAPARHAFAQVDDQPFYFLTDAEARFLAAACDTLIPEDEFPSASQAGVVDFIDLQLSGPYGQGEGLYMQGPFHEGTPQQGYQLPMVPAEMMRVAIKRADDVEGPLFDKDGSARHDFITRLSEGEIDIGGQVPAKTFFDELWKLTNQGFFADPIYGGNAEYAGWKMVGFPGAHAYYLSFVDKHNVPYRQPPMGINHTPGGSGAMPRPVSAQEG